MTRPAPQSAELLSATPRSPGRSAPAWAGLVLVLYLFSLVIGYGGLRSAIATARGNELSVDRALFMTVNAATLTGFRQAIGVTQLTAAGQAIVFGLIAIGAMTALIVGGLAVTRIIGREDSPGRIAAASVLLLSVAALLGGAGGWLAGPGADSGALLGVSAIGNSGTTLSPIPSAGTGLTQLVLLPLALIGGLGVVILLDVVDWLRERKPITSFTRVAVTWSAGAYIVGTVLVGLFSGDASWSGALVTGATAAIDSRSAGFGFGLHLARAAQWIVLGLMFIGPVSGGTGGGLKLNTLAVLWTGGRSALRGAAPGRLFGIAMVWLMIEISLIGFGLIALLLAEPALPGDRLLALVVSAAGNVGLSQDPISSTGPALFILSAIMLLGRIIPFATLWWTATTAREAKMPIG